MKAWLYGFLPGHHFSWEEETYCDETDIELKVHFLTRFKTLTRPDITPF